MSTQILEYWNFRNQLSVINGLVMNGEKIIIPQELRAEILCKIHSAHFGIQLCLRRARDVMFWPRISKDIIEMVSKCSICLEHRNANPKEPLIPLEVP